MTQGSQYLFEGFWDIIQVKPFECFVTHINTKILEWLLSWKETSLRTWYAFHYWVFGFFPKRDKSFEGIVDGTENPSNLSHGIFDLNN